MPASPSTLAYASSHERNSSRASPASNARMPSPETGTASAERVFVCVCSCIDVPNGEGSHPADLHVTAARVNLHSVVSIRKQVFRGIGSTAQRNDGVGVYVYL